MSEPKTQEPKKWNLTKEELQQLQAFGNVIGFLHDLIEKHMSQWIDATVKPRLSIPKEQLVKVSLENGQIEEIKAQPNEKVGGKEQNQVQSADAGVEEQKPQAGQANK